MTKEPSPMKEDNMAEDTREKEYEEMNDNTPGLDKQGAMYMAQQAGEYASPCEYCNRGDCVECAFSR